MSLLQELDAASPARDFVLYDGECPFCSAYVRMQRLKAADINVSLLDAREFPDIVSLLNRRGLDINKGMFMRLGNATYFGADVMHAIAMMSGRTRGVNRIVGMLFANRRVATMVYPVLRTMRNLTLMVLRREPITLQH